jgi:hypothetical protein
MRRQIWTTRNCDIKLSDAVADIKHCEKKPVTPVAFSA